MAAACLSCLEKQKDTAESPTRRETPTDNTQWKYICMNWVVCRRFLYVCTHGSFSSQAAQNILPFDGETVYYGPVFSSTESRDYYEKLLNEIPWKNDEAIVFGKHYITKRKVAWFGDSAYRYTYSGVTKQAYLWTPALLALKKRVEEISGAHYNSCLLNLYHNGLEGMSWHSDAEKHG